MCLSHLNADRYYILFRLKCTNIVWEELLMPAFFLVHQFIFNLSDTVPLLLVLPRFCYAEILELALFVLWLRWSLCQSFMVRKRKKDVPSCSHRTFQLRRVKVQSLLDCYLFKKKKKIGTVCVAWCSHGHWIKKEEKKSTRPCHADVPAPSRLGPLQSLNSFCLQLHIFKDSWLHLARLWQELVHTHTHTH